MPAADIADQYFALQNRVASFQTVQSKKRGSNATTKAQKSLKWPHKFLSPEELANAGFFFRPNADSPDNVACFLCHTSLDGWEKGDDPLEEHRKHSSNCGWAIVATIARQDAGELRLEDPASARMTEARRATFGDKWPHEDKKGWKCKVKQLVDAGWKYTPTPEYDDMATCTYCDLALDGWEPVDKPLDEHLRRSPDCAFFALINDHKQAGKRAKKDRSSKASRLSTQSSFTAVSEAPSFIDDDLPAEDEDSILTTATNTTAKKMGKVKKVTSGKGKKTKAKKDEAVEVTTAPEPEEEDLDVEEAITVKPTRGRKRKTEDTVDSSMVYEAEEPAPKRRATRSRASVVSNDASMNESTFIETSKPTAGGRKRGRPSTRKASTASVAPFLDDIPNDDEIDAALEADLEKPLTDDEERPVAIKKSTRFSKIIKPDHNIFGTDSADIDEVAIEAELEAMEAESRPLPKAKGAKGKQPRKVSAKQQAAAREAEEAAAREAVAAEAEAEAAAELEAARIAAELEPEEENEEEPSLQIAEELENSILVQPSSPVVPSKKQRSSRQPTRAKTGRATRGSVMSASRDTTSMIDDSVADHEKESGSETDASAASQSTIVRGGKTRRSVTVKVGKNSKQSASKTIDKTSCEPTLPPPEEVESSEVSHLSPKVATSHLAVDAQMIEESFYTPAPDTPVAEVPTVNTSHVVYEDTPKENEPKATKARGRPPKVVVSPISAIQEPVMEMELEVEETPIPKVLSDKGKEKAVLPRSPTPPPKERTPSESPQSSDAENHPPSSKLSVKSTKPTTPHPIKLIPLASTPIQSPSRRNFFGGLQSTNPWVAVDLDTIFIKSPSNESGPARGLFNNAADKVKTGALTSPEKKMSVEEWIQHNAELAEERLRNECERMVGSFESAGTRAMQALEGIECLE